MRAAIVSAAVGRAQSRAGSIAGRERTASCGRRRGRCRTRTKTCPPSRRPCVTVLPSALGGMPVAPRKISAAFFPFPGCLPNQNARRYLILIRAVLFRHGTVCCLIPRRWGLRRSRRSPRNSAMRLTAPFTRKTLGVSNAEWRRHLSCRAGPRFPISGDHGALPRLFQKPITRRAPFALQAGADGMPAGLEGEGFENRAGDQYRPAPLVGGVIFQKNAGCPPPSLTRPYAAARCRTGKARAGYLPCSPLQRWAARRGNARAWRTAFFGVQAISCSWGRTA